MWRWLIALVSLVSLGVVGCSEVETAWARTSSTRYE